MESKSKGKVMEKCAICLRENIVNKSFSNSCFHPFCFDCLLNWSKVKPECPLCKRTIHSIYYNIKNNTKYDEYQVPTLIPPPAYRIPRERYSPPERDLTDYRFPIHITIGSSRMSDSLFRGPEFTAGHLVQRPGLVGPRNSQVHPPVPLPPPVITIESDDGGENVVIEIILSDSDDEVQIPIVQLD